MQWSWSGSWKRSQRADMPWAAVLWDPVTSSQAHLHATGAVANSPPTQGVTRRDAHAAWELSEPGAALSWWTLHARLCYAMLCYAMLCCAMLCYAMLCYAMLCYAMLCKFSKQRSRSRRGAKNDCFRASKELQNPLEIHRKMLPNISTNRLELN